MDRPRIVGITGTNGKSTTTALIGHILKVCGKDVRVGGNIGIGVLDLEKLHAEAIYVLELSSYQLDLAESLRCDVAVMLNISPDHLSRHGGMDGYVSAKRRIFRNQGPDDYAIIGVDDMRSGVMSTQLTSEGLRRVIPISAEYGLGRGVAVLEGMLQDSIAGRAEHSVDIRNAKALPGRHNHQNIAAAYAACRALGLEPSDILAAIETFPGLPHRLENIGAIDGVRFINDSKATNAQAAEQAIRAFPNAWWIVGGRPKEEGIDDLAPLFGQVRKAYLIGEMHRGVRARADRQARPCRSAARWTSPCCRRSRMRAHRASRARSCCSRRPARASTSSAISSSAASPSARRPRTSSSAAPRPSPRESARCRSSAGPTNRRWPNGGARSTRG